MPGTGNREFGSRVRDLRRARGLTQEALAQRGGLSVEAVGRIERGAFSPTLETMEKIAGGLGVPFHELFHPHHSHGEPHEAPLGDLCRFVSGLEPDERQRVWSVLLNLFGVLDGREV